MNGESERPCESLLLWFIAQRMDDKKVINVSIDDIMREFKIDSFEAQTLIDNVTCPITAFVEKIGENQYRLTDFGIEEVDFLQHFVRVTANRKVNPRNVVRISVKLREWLEGIDVQKLSEADAVYITRLRTNKKKWTDEEIETAWRMYQGNVQADTQMVKEKEV